MYLWQDHKDARPWAHIICGAIAMIKKDLILRMKIMDHADDNNNNLVLETGMVTVACSMS